MSQIKIFFLIDNIQLELKSLRSDGIMTFLKTIVQVDAEEQLTNLKADTRYRAKIQTVNEFGASKWSEEYEFDTFGGWQGWLSQD